MKTLGNQLDWSLKTQIILIRSCKSPAEEEGRAATTNKCQRRLQPAVSDLCAASQTRDLNSKWPADPNRGDRERDPIVSEWIKDKSDIESQKMDNSEGNSRSPFATLKNIVTLANRGTVSPRRFSLVSSELSWVNWTKILFRDGLEIGVNFKDPSRNHGNKIELSIYRNATSEKR